jgi:hypothetical protein
MAAAVTCPPITQPGVARSIHVDLNEAADDHPAWSAFVGLLRGAAARAQPRHSE